MNSEPPTASGRHWLARFAAAWLARGRTFDERFRSLWGRLRALLGVPVEETDGILSEAQASGSGTLPEVDLGERQQLLSTLIKLVTGEGSLSGDARELLQAIAAGFGISLEDLDRAIRAAVEGRPPIEGPSPVEDAVPAVWNPGDIILDLYEVKDELGHGGYGMVQRVLHRGWNLELAVKSPLSGRLSDPQARETFVREAEAWVNLGMHPNIVSCFYVRTLGGIPRVFAELAEGGSLYDWIDDKRLYEGGPQESLRRVLDIAIQLCWGLHFVHEKGMVHQDFKPKNVVMTPEGIAKVTDFGLARTMQTAREAAAEDARASLDVGQAPPLLADQTVEVTAALGKTYTHCSPEQADAVCRLRAGVPKDQVEPLTRRTDMWSWAVTVLEMFDGKNRAGIEAAGQAARHHLDAYLLCGPADPTLPRMPDQVTAQLRQCLEADPDRRPHDLANVAAELTHIYAEATGEAYARMQPEAAKLLADALNNRAASLIDLGRKEQAEQALEQALQADPVHLYATYNHSLLVWRAGRISDEVARARVVQASTSHPGAWEGPYLAASMEIERGDEEAARKQLDDARGRAGADRWPCQQIEAATRSVRPGSQCLRTLRGHTAAVTAVAVTRDRRLAVSASIDKTLRVWDLASGRCLRTLEGHTEPVEVVAMTADGRLAVSASLDETVRVWDLALGRCLRTLEGHTKSVRGVALTPNGRLAVSASWDMTLRAWDPASGRCLRTVVDRLNWATAVALTADGRLTVSAGPGKTLCAWELASGRRLQTLEGHTNVVHGVALTADGRLAVSASSDKTLRVWDLASGRCLRVLQGHTDRVEAVALTADGRLAVSASSDKTLRVWDPASGRCLRTLEGHANEVKAVALTADGRLAISASQDTTLRLWILRAPQAAANYLPARPQRSEAAVANRERHASALARARASLAQGRMAEAVEVLAVARQVSGYERSRDAYQLSCQLLLRSERGAFRGAWLDRTVEGQRDEVHAVALTADGRLAVSVSEDGTLRVWDLASGRYLRTLQAHTRPVRAVAITGDARVAVSASDDRRLRVWEIASGRCLRTLEGHRHLAHAAALTSDSLVAVSASWDTTLRVWDLASGRCLRTLEGHTDSVNAVASTTDGRLAVSASWDKTLRVWDLAFGRCLRTLEGHTSSVNAVAMTPDGRLAVSASWDKTLRVWDVASGQCLRTLEGHTHSVEGVALAADSRLAVSASSDTTLRVWDLASGQCLQTLEGRASSVHFVALTPDAQLAVSGGDGGTLHVWHFDWELIPRDPADWDEGARPWLELFLSCHTPFVSLDPDHRDCLVRRGRASWTDADFEDFIRQLRFAGYGWLRPEGVRRELEKMAATWEGPPPLPGEAT